MDVSTDAGLPNATVTWTIPEAVDNVGVVGENSTHSPGIILAIGDTITVEYVAYDDGGLNATCQFDLTVIGTF